MAFIAASLSILLIFFGYQKFSTFDSAFEADQECHFSIKSDQLDAHYGCDHDLETRQWLLYKQSEEAGKSLVVKRFRY